MAQNEIFDEDEIDSCTELNRSVSLFFAITRVLAFSAIIVLLTTNRDPIYSVLMIDEKEAQFMEDIPYAFTVAYIKLLTYEIVTSIIGICGFARLNRYLLAVYGTSLILDIIIIFFVVLVSSTRDPAHHTIIGFYDDYTFSRLARQSINLLQQNFKCCGTSSFKFENMPILPSSCCPNLTDNICTWQEAYNTTCNTNKGTLYQSLEEKNLLEYIPYVLTAIVLISVLQSGLAFYMAHSISETFIDE